MNSFRKLYEKHPKFRKAFNTIYTKIDKLNILSWLSAAIIILSPTLTIFFNLPDKIKVPVTAIVSTILTSLIIPCIISYNKTKNEHKAKLYERNLPFYTELADKIIDVFQTTEQKEQRQKIVLLANYISDKYSYICLSLTNRQIDFVFNIKDECLMFFDPNNQAKASIDNIYENAESLFLEIRKQADLSGDIFLNEIMVEKLEMPKLGNMR